MSRSTLLLVCSWVIGIGLFGCYSTDSSDTEGAVYPNPDWAVETPEAHNLDSALLQEAADYAEENDSDCLVVTRDGVIVGEWYWNGWDATSEKNIFSATKSITSVLVGIAQDRGELDIEEKASKYIRQWIGTESEEVTIRNLISNDSGREWDLVTDYVLMYGLAFDKTAFSTRLGQQHEPGAYWEYNNSAIQTLEQILNMATGLDVCECARQRIFEPLGMASSFDRDADGNAIVFADVRASCRDLARLGYLYLRKGLWSGGRRIVSEAWLEESVEPSTPLNSAYGYMWWLNREGHWVLPTTPDGRSEGDGSIMSTNLPKDVYGAIGMGNQVVAVDPGTHIVFSRLGEVTAGAAPVSGEVVAGLAEKIRAALLDEPSSSQE